MTQETAEFFQAASDAAGHECEIREDYSGRCMYGRTTHAVIVESVTQLLSDVVAFVHSNVGEFAGDDGIRAWTGGEVGEPEDFRMDNMGRSTVIY